MENIGDRFQQNDIYLNYDFNPHDDCDNSETVPMTPNNNLPRPYA